MQWKPLQLLLVLAAVACVHDEVLQPAAPPRALRLLQDTIRGEVDSPVLVSAQVTDSAGRGVPDVPVRWRSYLTVWDPHGAYLAYFPDTLPVTWSDATGKAGVVARRPMAGRFVVVATNGGLADSAVLFTTYPASASEHTAWTRLSNLPAPRADAAAVARGGLVYVIGGWCFSLWDSCDAGFSNRVLVFDPVAGAWRPGALNPMSQSRGRWSAANLPDGIHVLRDSLHSVYDPGADAFSDRAAPPGDAGDGALGAIDGRLYMVLRDGRLAIYDPGADRWNAGATLPRPRFGSAFGVLAGKLYVAGGNTAGTALDRYDPATRQWTALADMPLGRGDIAGGAVGGRFCVFGGGFAIYRGESGFAETYCYDPARDRWALAAPSLMAGHGVAAAALGDTLYAFGGWGIAYYYSTATASSLAARLAPR